jgi:hypothetical protein
VLSISKCFVNIQSKPDSFVLLDKKEEEAHHLPFSSFPFQNVLSVSNQNLTAQCSLLNYLSSWVHAFMGWMNILIT